MEREIFLTSKASISEIKEIIKSAINREKDGIIRTSIFLWGKPGVGKSEIPIQAVFELNREFVENKTFEERRYYYELSKKLLNIFIQNDSEYENAYKSFSAFAGNLSLEQLKQLFYDEITSKLQMFYFGTTYEKDKLEGEAYKSALYKFMEENKDFLIQASIETSELELDYKVRNAFILKYTAPLLPFYIIVKMLSQENPVSAVGLFYPNDKNYESLRFLRSFFKRIQERDKLGLVSVIYFDELINAEPDVVSAIWELINERRLEGYKFSKVLIISAGNLILNRIRRFNPALWSRYENYLVEPKPDEIVFYFMEKYSHLFEANKDIYTLFNGILLYIYVLGEQAVIMESNDYALQFRVNPRLYEKAIRVLDSYAKDYKSDYYPIIIKRLNAILDPYLNQIVPAVERLGEAYDLNTIINLSGILLRNNLTDFKNVFNTFIYKSVSEWKSDMENNEAVLRGTDIGNKVNKEKFIFNNLIVIYHIRKELLKNQIESVLNSQLPDDNKAKIIENILKLFAVLLLLGLESKREIEETKTEQRSNIFSKYKKAISSSNESLRNELIAQIDSETDGELSKLMRSSDNPYASMNSNLIRIIPVYVPLITNSLVAIIDKADDRVLDRVKGSLVYRFLSSVKIWTLLLTLL